MKPIATSPDMHFALARLDRAKAAYAKAHPVAERDAEAVYDGREYLGQLVVMGRGARMSFDAYDADDDYVGLYRERSEAIAALKSDRDARRIRVGGAR